MTESCAFIGDIHGNIQALDGLLGILKPLRPELMVFLGDYVNRGPASRSVIERLLELREEAGQQVVTLAGNHELAMLDCIKNGAVARFLKMGGASTIANYVTWAHSNVASQFAQSVPVDHIRFLEELENEFETDTIIARHQAPSAAETRKFRVGGHVRTGTFPIISANFALLDTGCSGEGDGRLTAMLWPSRSILQVDAQGNVIP